MGDRVKMFPDADTPHLFTSFSSTREDGAMSRFPIDLGDLLVAAVEATRAALSDLESDEVPASLRRVAAYTGGRLPPPLVTSVLTALDQDEWLREKAAVKLRPELESSAAAAFLERSDGWWHVIGDALADARSADAATSASEAEAAAGKLTTQLQVAKDRLKKAAADLDHERARARKPRPAPAISDVRAAREKKSRARLVELESSLSAEVEDRVEAEAMIARLRSRLRRVARGRRRPGENAGAASSLGGDPTATARTLDLMAAAAPHRMEQTGLEEEAVVGTGALELPPGVRPDAREAVDWIGSIEDPLTLIVDGYNVLYKVDPARTTGRYRDALAQQMVRFRRGAGTARVVVVYDSDLPGDREGRILPGGIEVHFADEDLLADDEIVDLAAAARGSAVVITSDRELRERSEAVGALTLWSEALVGWMAPRSG